MSIEIDPKALYTVEQAARMLMEVEPHLTHDEAVAEIDKAIASGKLRVAGYLAPTSRATH